MRDEGIERHLPRGTTGPRRKKYLPIIIHGSAMKVPDDEMKKILEALKKYQ